MKKLIIKDIYNSEVIAEFGYDSFFEVDEKVKKLHTSQKKWKKLSVKERLEVLQPCLKYFEDNRDEIARDVSKQIGRPEKQCGSEVNGFFERADALCKMAEEVLSPDIFTDKEGFDRSIHHEAFGVIFVVAAWNYPLLITVNSVVPALLAGNAILLKHSNRTPLIGQHFEKAFCKMGAFENLLIQTICDHSVTGQVIEESTVGQVIFTGSVNGGRAILSHASKQFITPLLELGGKDAAYIHSDANLEDSVASVVDGALFNSGQSCCGIERVYAHESLYEDFLASAKKIMETYVLGDPSSDATNLGPVASEKVALELKVQVDAAQKMGAKVLFGGEVEKIADAFFFQPTLITNVTNDMELMQEENFGPILPVMKVNSIEEAIEKVNDSKFGLTASIFCKDKETANIFARDVESGTVFMNRCDYLDPTLPWTGYKNSGSGGSSLSKHGFYGVTKRKSYHFKL